MLDIKMYFEQKCHQGLRKCYFSPCFCLNQFLLAYRQPTPVSLPGESQGRGAQWAAVYGVAQSKTQLKRLSSSSSSNTPLCICTTAFLCIHLLMDIQVVTKKYTCICVSYSRKNQFYPKAMVLKFFGLLIHLHS